MITDVVTDVRDTIDCTVEAVESALALGSTISNPKCRGVIKNQDNGNTKGISLNIPDTEFNGIKNDDYNIDSKPFNYENENLKYKFTNDEDRLAYMKKFLKDEFDKMSASMRIQFKEIESEEKSAADAILKYINILHNMKHNSKSDSEVNEAKRILDGASKILNANNNSNVNKILTLHESNQDKVNMQNTMKIADNKFTNNMHNATHLSTGTLKDIFNKALGTHVKDNNQQRNQGMEGENSPLPGIDLSHHTIENNDEPMDYDSLFGHSESNKDAIDDATKILEDSQRTNSILNNFFSQAAQAGSSIFDNP